jgi:phosphatidylglycerophosphatase C
MNTISVSDVLAALDRAPREAVVAFDCDGTLWSGDVGEDWFVELVERAGFHERASRAMRDEARAHEINADGSDRAVAEALLDAMNRGRYEEHRLYELMAWAGAGRTDAEVSSVLDAMLARVGLASRLHGETLAILRAAEARGLRTVAVSASPLAVIEACLRHVSVVPAAVCAATQAVEDGVLAPRLAEPLPYREGKVRALRAAVGDAPVVAALGDSGFDLEMLALASVPLAVRPKKGLRDRAVELQSLRELEVV